MHWIDEALDRLAAAPLAGYHADDPPATEPTALTAMALLAAGKNEPAMQATRWLAEQQAEDGSVGVRASEPTPRWPTSLAMLAWQASSGASREVERAVQWILSMEGKTQPRSREMGHDSTLVAWPWAEGTHGWIEPTALHVLALKASGHGDHPRTREAVRMLLDRQLPGGGCNYGNTMVLGQMLRPHVQPTGIAMLALAGEPRDIRVQQSLAYLGHSLSPESSAASMSWALLSLAAHDSVPAKAKAWLAAAYRRTVARGRSPHKIALLALAALGKETPLVKLPQRATAS